MRLEVRREPLQFTGRRARRSGRQGFRSGVEVGPQAAVGPGSSCRSQCAGSHANRAESELCECGFSSRSLHNGPPAQCRRAVGPKEIAGAGAGQGARARVRRCAHVGRAVGWRGRGAGERCGRALHRGGRREARRRRQAPAETLRPQDTFRRRPRGRGPEADWRPTAPRRAAPRASAPRPPSIWPRTHPAPARKHPRGSSLILNPYLCVPPTG
ncbi:unnamed protein product [Pieris macdunnoughi]|uniref:Uncharacterized protein n=1 Tax=Pieris macdunnoughi TaxID=345717 RepID=A0A821VGM2_9NEOP|nr:unnamed protein product [Pieris macdunnoughi]